MFTVIGQILMDVNGLILKKSSLLFTLLATYNMVTLKLFGISGSLRVDYIIFISFLERKKYLCFKIKISVVPRFNLLTLFNIKI